MRILYTLPTVRVPHGGFIIVFEHILGLSRIGHDVGLFVEDGHPGICINRYKHINVVVDKNSFLFYDCIVICSPHSIWIEEHLRPHQKCFIFMQMDERMFRQKSLPWEIKCLKFYKTKHTIIYTSAFAEEVFKEIDRRGPSILVGDGTNFNDFPIEQPVKTGDVILLESPVNNNPAKDVDLLAVSVAQELYNKGYYIIAYGAKPINIDWIEYYVNPSIEKLNNLYARASVLIKATRYDFRSLAPKEAGTKMCATSRAIIKGDDDLVNEINCLRCDYDYDDLRIQTERLINDASLRTKLAVKMQQYLNEYCQWGPIIKKLNEIITG